MKKYGMLVVAFAFMLSLSAIAQDQMPPKGERGPKKEFRRGDRPQPTAEMRADRLAKQLNLTDAEKVKVKTPSSKDQSAHPAAKHRRNQELEPTSCS